MKQCQIRFRFCVAKLRHFFDRANKKRTFFRKNVLIFYKMLIFNQLIGGKKASSMCSMRKSAPCGTTLTTSKRTSMSKLWSNM